MTEGDIFKGSDGVTINIISDSTEAAYHSYVRCLLNEGFSLYDMHSVGSNYFSVLIKKEEVHAAHATANTVRAMVFAARAAQSERSIYSEHCFSVHVYYSECSKEMRVITDSYWIPYEKKHKNILSVCGTTLYQFELDFRNIDCGMCYVIRTCSGNFFIIDSAHMNSVNDHIRLHDFLRHLVPKNEKICIKGWFFSHAHQDHIAKFMDFIESGFDDYKIEKLYYNFPSLEFAPGHEEWDKGDNQTIEDFNSLIKKHAELKVCKLHSGNHFYIDNLEFEVLGTHEDIYPLSVARFNDTSTVLMMTVDDCKILFPGDANNKMSYLLVSRYGDLLKSDILQLSHHGFSGGTPELYERSKCSVVLVPTDKKHFEENLYREANKTALRYAKEVYICSEGTVSLPLPYKNGCAKIYETEIK